MFDLNVLQAARSASLVLCAVVFAVSFAAILLAHWSHRRAADEHFHASTLKEMSWSLAPMLMVLAVVGVTFKDHLQNLI